MSVPTCCGVDCSKPTKMQCPTCKKLNIDVGCFFCDQECFKKNWGTHKALHKAAKAAMPGPIKMSFNFTGPLRPWKQTPYRDVSSHIVRTDYADDGYPTSEMQEKNKPIKICNAEEIAGMKVVCRLGREVLDECAKAVKVGATTDEIDRVCHEACLARDCYPSPLNYHEFPKSCCTSVNEVICHGIPDLRPLKDGDIVNVDISVYFNNFHGDLNETFLVGKVDDESYNLIKTTYECIWKAIKECRPGMRYREIGNIISKHAHQQQFSVVRSYCGHGIHNLFHCAPNVPHYAKNKAVATMKPGHIFTIEPMINVGVWNDLQWPDNWTAVTYDGKRSAQFEHTLLITETGYEILTGRLADSPRGPHWFEDDKRFEGQSTIADKLA